MAGRRGQRQAVGRSWRDGGCERSAFMYLSAYLKLTGKVLYNLGVIMKTVV